MAWSQEQILDWWKGENPTESIGISDEELYKQANQWSNNMYNLELSPFIPKTPPPTSVGAINLTPGTENDESEFGRVDTSPKKIEGLLGLAASIGTDLSLSGALAEAFPKGVDLPGERFDITPEFFKKSYNESLAGQAYQVIYGQEAYNVDDYEPSWMAEAGGFLLGMANAPEVAAFATGSKLGIWGAGMAQTALERYALLGLSTSAIATGATAGIANRTMRATMVSSALETGLALGTLGAAHSATHEAAVQRKTTGTVDVTKVFKQGAKGFTESFLIGAPAGGLAKGLLASKYGAAKLASDEKSLDIVRRVMYGLPGQITAEALAFTTLPNLYKGLGTLTGVDAPVVDFDETPGILTEGWTQSLFQNTVVIGTMAGFGYAARKSKGIDDAHIWAMKLLEQGEKDIKKIVNSSGNVKQKLQSAGIKVDPELIKTIAQQQQQVFSSKEENKNFKQKQEEVNKIIEKIDTKGAESLSTKEVNFLADNALPVKLAELGLWKELEQNENMFRKVVEEAAGRTVTNEEFENVYKKVLDNKIKQTIETFNRINEQGGTGIGPQQTPKATTPVTGETPLPGGPRTYTQKTIVTKENPQGIKKETVTTLEAEQRLIEQNKNITNPEAQWVPEQISGAKEQSIGSKLEQKLENIEQRVVKLTSEINVSDINADVTARNLLGKTDKYTQQIKNTIVNPDDRNLAAYLLDLYPVERGKQKVFIDNVKEILGFVRKKYNKPISELNTPELTKLVKDYIQEKANFDVFDKKAWKNLDEKQKITLGRFVDKTRDNMFEIFGDTAGGLAGLLKTNPLDAFKKVGIKGQRSITIVGGKDGLKGWIKYVQSKAKHVFKSGKEEISLNKEEGYLFSELFLKSEVRPEEIANLKVKDITDTGINISLSKGKGITPDKVRFIEVEPNLLKQFKKMVEGKNTSSFVFPNLNTSKKISDFVRHLSDNTKFKIQIKDEATGKFYELGEKIPGGKKVGNISGVKSMTAETGLSLGRVFRAVFTNKKSEAKSDKAKERMQSERAYDEYIVEPGKEKFQLTAEGQPASPKELAPWLDAQIKKNPGLVLKKLKDADFVGRFYEGVIDVTMGKANKFTFFHENAHRLKAMIDASGNKRLSKVWNQAEKLFKKDAKGRNMEEFLADEIAKYGLKREQPANLKQKIGGWLNRVWSTVKSVFFGKEKLNKNDVRNILGEKVFKGFEFNTNSRANSIARYKYATVEEFSKGLKKQFEDSIVNKLPSSEKKALEEYIASTSGMENPELFKLGNNQMLEADLVLFQERMKDIPFLEIKSTAEISQKARLIKNIDLNSKKAFTPEQQQNVMKLLGFKGKTLWGASVRELKAYSEIVNSTRMPGQDRHAGIAERATTGELSEAMREMDGLMGDLAKSTLPVGSIMRKLGLKDIAGKMEDHISVELNHVGAFVLFETAGERLLGKGRFNKAKEHMYLIDVERYIERLDSGILKANEKKFIEKAFKSNWLIKKDGKTIKNPKYKKLINKSKPEDSAVNLNTAEGKLVQAWDGYTDYVYKSFKESVKSSMSEVEYANFKADNKIQWIRDNIYVSRLVTKEFKQTFNLDSNLEKLVQKQAAPIAEKLAKKKYNTDKPTQEQIGSMWEDAEIYVRRDVSDMLEFHRGKHSTRFLKKRHEKLPEFVEIDGKKIQVYETNYENTLKKYALGMSKFMANTEVFPEFVKLDGMNFPGQRAAIDKLITSNNRWGPWARDRVLHQLGYLQKPGEYRSKTAEIMSGAAQVLAKTQLSFPTSGLKNVILGQTATLQAFRIRDYFAGLAKVMSKEFRDEVKGTGATEIGLRHIQDLNVGKFLDKIFWFGGMKPTENFNRYMSIAASKVQQDRLVRIIQNKNSPAGKVKKAERRLEDFYSLSKSEIGSLKKYGMNNVDGVTFKSSFEKAKQRRVMQNIYNKMNSMAHIKTQGASLSFFMPEWADGKFLRPLTLFKRMAYAATTNSVNNFKLAYKNGDMVKMGAMMLGPYLTGTALISVYGTLFDQKPPTENSDAWSHMKYVYMRGEVLGVLSDFLRMYEGEGAQQTMYPALYNYLLTAGSTVLKVSKGQMNWGQTAEEMAMASFGAYRGGKKLYDKQNNQFYMQKKRYRKLYYKFLEETFPNKADDMIGERKLNRRSPYYKDFEKTFFNGTDKDFAKQFIITTYAIATDLYNENLTAEGLPTKYKNFNEAYKQAMKNMKTKLKTLNPNPGNFTRKDKSYAHEWMKWLGKDKEKSKEYLLELAQLESQYYAKLRRFKSIAPGMFKDPELAKLILKEFKKLK